MEIINQYITLVPIGFGIATLASLLGIGGGILWAPYLILVRGLEPTLAIMTSMLIQSIGMGSALSNYIRKRMIYWNVSLGILPFIIVGLICGAYLNQKVASKQFLEGGLGIVTMIMAIFFAFQTEDYDIKLITDKNIKAPLKVKTGTIFFGSLSGLFSIGVGDFVIPILRTKMKIPMQNAIGISHFLNFSVALIGGILHVILSKHSYTDFMYIVLFAGIGVFIGGQVGPRLGEKIGDAKMKEIFIFILLLLGIHLIFQAL